MSLSSGTKLGRYQILSPLGAGGMGEVYRALDLQLEREVAIKVLPQRIAEDRVALKRLEREARAVASISHPNILDIHDFGMHDGVSYVVTELLEGRTLKESIQKGPLHHQEAVKIAISIAEGLHAAHSKGIIHRDLKPDNIFITSDFRVKILDFGLALLKPVISGDALSDASTASGLSNEGLVNGTVPYMSPEQLRGQTIDSRSDIFAFGSVFYEMIAGHPPFFRETIADSVAAILREEPSFALDIHSSVPPVINRILRMCLEKDPARRVPDAHHLISLLKEAESTGLSVPIITKHTHRSRMRWALIGSIGVLFLIAALTLGYFRNRFFIPAPHNIHSIVVLPLKNLSGNPQDEYFVDGITEELTTRLSRFANLRVISRTSAMHYKQTEKSLKEIGSELDVDAVLEGSIRRMGGRIRVVTNLIEATSDRSIWSQTYDHEMKDILALQNEVAYNVSRELKMQLTPAEKARLEETDTVSAEAYDSYLQGLSHEQKHDFSRESVFKEISFYEKAVRFDPNFALAYVALARAHGVMHHFGFDKNIDHASATKNALDRAFEIEPGLPEAEVALGYYYYWCLKDYDRALSQFESASNTLPSNTKALEGIAYIERRYGDCEKALNALRRAVRLSPKELRILSELGNTLSLMHQYAEADAFYQRAIEISPNEIDIYKYRVDNYYLWNGRTERIKEILEKFPTRNDRSSALYWYEFYVATRNYRAALDTLESSDIDIYDRHPFFTTKEQMIANVYRFANQPKRAREYYEKARAILETNLSRTPHDPRILTSLGLVYAGLGLVDEAIAKGRRGAGLYPMEKDRFDGFFREIDLVKIYVMTGNYDAALDDLERLLSIPSLVSVPLLQLDPVYEPLLSHPRFQKLAERFR